MLVALAAAGTHNIQHATSRPNHNLGARSQLALTPPSSGPGLPLSRPARHQRPGRHRSPPGTSRQADARRLISEAILRQANGGLEREPPRRWYGVKGLVERRPAALLLSMRTGHGGGATASGVKRLRPTGRDVRRSTEVNRDVLYEPDEHLKRDA